VKNDGVIDANDKQFTKPITQEFYGGFQNSFSYKGVELDVLFQFVKQTGFSALKNTTFPGYFNGGAGNQPTYALNHWQKQGDVAVVEKYTQQATVAQTAWRNAIQSGDY